MSVNNDIKQQVALNTLPAVQEAQNTAPIAQNTESKITTIENAPAALTTAQKVLSYFKVVAAITISVLTFGLALFNDKIRAYALAPVRGMPNQPAKLPEQPVAQPEEKPVDTTTPAPAPTPAPEKPVDTTPAPAPKPAPEKPVDTIEEPTKQTSNDVSYLPSKNTALVAGGLALTALAAYLIANYFSKSGVTTTMTLEEAEKATFAAKNCVLSKDYYETCSIANKPVITDSMVNGLANAPKTCAVPVVPTPVPTPVPTSTATELSLADKFYECYKDQGLICILKEPRNAVAYVANGVYSATMKVYDASANLANSALESEFAKNAAAKASEVSQTIGSKYSETMVNLKKRFA